MEWVTDPAALKMLFALDEIRVGDRARFLRLAEDCSHARRGGVCETAVISGLSAYNNDNLETDAGTWRLVGWKRGER